MQIVAAKVFHHSFLSMSEYNSRYFTRSEELSGEGNDCNGSIISSSSFLSSISSIEDRIAAHVWIGSLRVYEDQY